MATLNKNFFISLFIISFLSTAFGQKADHIVIAEIYGGGGNSGAHWKYDYIVLYNPTLNSVDLSSWSIQYASATGKKWLITNLSSYLSPGKYYLIQQETGGVGNDLPVIPNVIGSISMSATAGKVALVNNQIEITGETPLPNSNIVDLVGYGSSASEYEGSGPTSNLSNTKSIRRKDNSGNNTYGLNGSGYDTDDNFYDFYVEDDLVANAPLPVELSSFTSSIINKEVHLNWRTETEVSNYGFDVERKINSDNLNLDWEKIGFVHGNGCTNSPKEYCYVDKSASSGKYFYRLKQIDTDGKFEYSKIVEVDFDKPVVFKLEQNYPNPFNPTTTIKFQFDKSTKADLRIYNVLGNEVANLFNENVEAGKLYEVNFDASNLASGVYYYRLTGDSRTEIRKMMLIK